MKRILLTSAVLTLLAAPAASQAEPSDSDRTNAAQECRAERGDSTATREAFAARYGTNANRRNAFGKCVSQRSRSEERQREEAEDNAAKQCKSERELDAEAFAAKYGTNANKRNAFGKCVSQQAREAKAERDEADAEKTEARKSAARDCRTERTEMGREAFAQKYGTNANKRNAFGKCVSQGARS